MPIYHGGHSGGNPDAILAFYLAVNSLIILYYVVRAIIFPFITSKWAKTWCQYVLGDYSGVVIMETPYFGTVTMAAVILNGFAAIFCVAELFMKIL